MRENDQAFARKVIIAIALGSLFALLCYTARLLLLGFAGVLGAVVLDSAAGWVTRKLHLRHRWSYLLVIMGCIGLLALALWILVPRVVVQLSQLTDILPGALNNVREYLNRYQWGYIVTTRAGNVGAGTIASKVTQIGTTMLDVGIALVVMVVLTAYLAEEPAYYRKGVLKLLPSHWRPQADELFQEINETLRWWLIGQSIPMFVLGVVTTITLMILDVPLAFTLGLFTGVMIFIPFAGAVIAWVVTALVTLSYDASKLILVTALFLGVHILEGYVLTPLVQRRAVYLPPVVTIVSQVLMSMLFGFLGLVLATPVAAATMVLVRRMYMDRLENGHAP